MSFSLNDAELDERLEQIPVLAGRSRQLEELSGGLTNRNVKVTTSDGVYVARCCDTTSNLLGIDREQEYFNTMAAERAGVGAPVIDYAPDLGILLLGYLEGTTLTNADFRRPGVVAKAARAIRTLHRGPALPWRVRHVRAPAELSEHRAAQRVQDSERLSCLRGAASHGSRPSWARATRRRCRATTTCWQATSSKTATRSG